MTPDMKVDLEKIETLVEPVALSIGCELVACEWAMESGRATLRVLIDKPGGILVEDCERLSYLLDPLLDVEDLIPQRYNLEISSPGLERPLKKLRDFERFAGCPVRLKTKIPIENRSHFKGEIKQVEGDMVFIKTEGIIFQIPFKEIHRAKLEVDWSKELKKKKK